MEVCLFVCGEMTEMIVMSFSLWKNAVKTVDCWVQKHVSIDEYFELIENSYLSIV